ncbi:regulatory protein [Burkholderia multivorans]
MVKRRGEAGMPDDRTAHDAPRDPARRAASPGAGRRAASRTATRASDDALVSFAAADPYAFETADPFDDDESFDAYDRARRRVSGVGFSRAGTADAPGAAQDVYTRTSQTPRRARRAGAPSDGGADATGRPSSSSKPVRSLKGRALGYLSRREYSRAELARKLAPYAGEGESVEPVLDALEQEGWLSDARFAESLVHRRASRVGTARIVGELRRHAVGDALVEEVGAQLRETEWARAQAVWRKKFGAVPQTPAERAKQARFLATRGFSRATIVKLLKGGDELFGDD